MNRRRMMLGGDKAFVTFEHVNELSKAVWIEENGRKIFDPETFKIQKGKEIVFCMNASRGSGIVNLNGETVFSGSGNVSYGFIVRKDILVTAEIQRYIADGGSLGLDYVIEITEK